MRTERGSSGEGSASPRWGKQVGGCSSEGAAGEAALGAQQLRQPYGDELLLSPCQLEDLCLCHGVATSGPGSALPGCTSISTLKAPLKSYPTQPTGIRWLGGKPPRDTEDGQSSGTCLEQACCPGAEQRPKGPGHPTEGQSPHTTHPVSPTCLGRTDQGDQQHPVDKNTQ